MAEIPPTAAIGNHRAHTPADWHTPAVDEVRRDTDDELCGHVAEMEGSWRALTVFGAELGWHDTRAGAVSHVLEEGLASLAERWTLRHGATGEDEIVCLQEANQHGVTVARGYYSMPGVPTLRITRSQLAAGEWELLR